MRSSTTMRLLLGLVSALLCANFTASAQDAKTKKELSAEEKEAQAEEEAESKLNQDLVQIRFEGKLMLYGEPDQSNPVIVGTFTSSGRVYLLKVAEPPQVARLKEYNGKTVTLIGKIRNSGKYFVFRDIIEGGAAPAAYRKRGGI
jgi:hypothetical protein